MESELRPKYKIYEGVRCILVIIPSKIKKMAGLNAGDYITYEYDAEKDEITMRPVRDRPR